MAKNKDLEVLKNLLNKNFSKEEIEELLDSVNKKTETISKKEQINHFLDMDLDEDKKLREVSKKLNNTSKTVGQSKRREVKMIDVECQNCGKIYNLPENYPGNLKNFICCVR